MTPAQVRATQIPVNDLVDMIIAIGSRDYTKFQELENNFAQQHGVEVWEEVLFGLKWLKTRRLVVDIASGVLALGNDGS